MSILITKGIISHLGLGSLNAGLLEASGIFPFQSDRLGGKMGDLIQQRIESRKLSLIPIEESLTYKYRNELHEKQRELEVLSDHADLEESQLAFFELMEDHYLPALEETIYALTAKDLYIEVDSQGITRACRYRTDNPRLFIFHKDNNSYVDYDCVDNKAITFFQTSEADEAKLTGTIETKYENTVTARGQKNRTTTTVTTGDIDNPTVIETKRNHYHRTLSVKTTTPDAIHVMTVGENGRIRGWTAELDSEGRAVTVVLNNYYGLEPNSFTITYEINGMLVHHHNNDNDVEVWLAVAPE